MAAVIRAVSLATLLATVGCQAAPAEPWIIESWDHPGVKIKYRSLPTRLCDFQGVNSYSGYIDIPANLDPAFQNYNASYFFSFFEARIAPKTAPLTLWLQGGPGEASVNQAFSGHNGPCIVQKDSQSTKINLNSWNDFSNMLYLDQPTHTGCSYDSIVDGFENILTGDITPAGTGPSTVVNRKGRFSSQNPANTANTTAIAAKIVTHFLDLWMEKFPTYKRDEIEVWSQSYGGHWAPAIAIELLKQGKIGVNSVGIINGVIDIFAQAASWPDFAVNNTYGIQTTSPAFLAQAIELYNMPGGCKEQGDNCRILQARGDPNNYANNSTVATACSSAVDACQTVAGLSYNLGLERSTYDIADLLPITFPPPYATGYLNNDWVQTALGAKVNFTESSTVVNHNFYANGDPGRGYTKEIANLIDAGVKLSLLHGDRDFLCNWFGGEAVALAVPYSRQSQFVSSGYRPIVFAPNSSIVNAIAPKLSTPVGQVRQQGRFSFARIYQAGHEGPYYQPEVYHALFLRTVLGLDLETGLKGPVSDSYVTTGPKSVRDVNLVAPVAPRGVDGNPVDLSAVECYVDAVPLTANSRCTQAQLDALTAGTAIINSNRVVVQPAA